MDWRNFINEHPRAVLVGVVLAILTAGAGVWFGGRAPVVPDFGVLFFEERSGQFSRCPAGSIPPVPGKDSRGELVRAVLAREPATKENVRYLFKFTPAARAALQRGLQMMAPGQMEAAMSYESQGKLVRSLEPDAQWVPADSREGQALMAE